MTSNDHGANFRFAISLSILNHLGRNLYRSFITVLGEAISNAWDADAKNVWIHLDRERSMFSIKDDGMGMTTDDFQSKFLKIGYSKRADGQRKTEGGRPFIGAKGIGKLALLSCAQTISVFSKTRGSSYIGGVIDNTGLDQAIKDDVEPGEYELKALNFELIENLQKNHKQGTIVVFEKTKKDLKTSIPQLKKLLAMSFRFSLIDTEFSIFVNDQEVTVADLKDLITNTQFLWLLGNYEDDYVASLMHLKEGEILNLEPTITIRGFLATVLTPRHLKITSTDERASVDLFVGGRLRERNILRHIPTQRIVESYVYGQIHFDSMDRIGIDPFTSSREGIVENDEEFLSLLKYLRETAIPKLIDQWDKLRLKSGKDGDDEHPRKTKKERRARSLYAAAREEFAPENGAPAKDQVEKWLDELRNDATFNLSAYVDCFVSENLLRNYLREHEIGLSRKSPTHMTKWKKNESQAKARANISFDIRQKDDDVCYLDMAQLAHSAEGHTAANIEQSLTRDAHSYRPVRNVVSHTGLLTPVAKTHLTTTFENIKARVKALVFRQKATM